MPLLIGSAANQVPVNGLLGNLAFQDAEQRAIVKETLSNKTMKNPSYAQDNDGSVSGGWVIDYNNGPLIKATVGGTITSISLSNLPPSGVVGHLKLMLVNPGAYGITFPAAWKFIRSDFTTTTFAGLSINLPSSGVVFMDLITDDSGNNVYVTISRT